METFKEQNDFINRLSVNMEEAIRNAMECFRITTNCMQHCLSLSEKHAEVKHITLLKECAELCQITASFLIVKSDFAHDVCGVCARVCEACADSCEEIDDRDAMMKLCIHACRDCAESCRNMEH
jgi:hypothetical protein